MFTSIHLKHAPPCKTRQGWLARHRDALAWSEYFEALAAAHSPNSPCKARDVAEHWRKRAAEYFEKSQQAI